MQTQIPASSPASTSSLLEIKNWTKYQKPNTTQWIKDYSNREDDREFALLTFTQRAMLEGLCRLRARLRKAIPYDPLYIARALQVLPEERHCCARTLKVLIRSGFLIPTDKQSVNNPQETAETPISGGQETPKQGLSGGQDVVKTGLSDEVLPQNQQLSFSNSHRLEKKDKRRRE